MKHQFNQRLQNNIRLYVTYVLALFNLLILSTNTDAQTSRQFKDTTITTSATYTYNTIRILPNTTITPSAGQSIRLVAPATGCNPLNNALSSAQNYILTAIPRIPGYVPGQGGYTSCDVMQAVQYIDGLGRPLQTVQVKGTPNADKDLVQPFAYDAYGREAIKYLPYAAPGTDGSYKADALSAGAGLQNFYNPGGNGASGAQQANGVVVNPAPYGQTVFEPSPLNRVTEQGAPGTPWQPGSGHTTRTVYAANDAATYPAKRYDVSIDGTTGARTLSTPGNYDVNQLYVTVMMDENWSSGKPGTMEEYKDKEDRVVLKRTYDDSGTALSTYYVYDDLGNLAFVLTPGSNADNAQPDQTTLDNLCYQYRYDERNRVSRKKLPGKGWEYVVYNKLDQPVMTQDANQRNKAPQEWTFSKYDAMGRLVISGIYTHPGSTAGTDYFQTFKDISDGWAAGNLWEVAATGSTGYTNRAIPTGNIKAYLSVNYYDSYSGIPGLPAAYSAPAGAMGQPTGLLTASKTTVLNTLNNAQSDVLWAVNYYDDKGRNMAAYQQHYLNANANTGNYDLLTTAYNFSNEIISTNRQHYTAAGGSPALTLTNTYSYDHMGRKTKSYEQINGGANVLLSQADYNDIGQLKTKHLGNDIQQIAYTYNERGWLKTSSAPLFAMQLNYNDGTAPQYNGNIANQYWGTPGSLNKSYTYSYDKLNRLTAGVASDNNTEQGITYDLMGNITALNRTGTLTHSLAYSYTGNQLTSVSNSGAAFRSYGYDANGNATSDGQGNAISYNMLNLPQSIPGKGLTYTYDAAGTKLRKVSGTTTTEYISGIQYTGTAIDFVQTEEGRAINSGGSYTYEYNLADHLGNTRLSLNQNGVTKQQDDYYPFGLEINRSTTSPKNEYLYNKKELQEELGYYDYNARFYDPVIGKFTTIDLLAEKDRRWNSYSYGHNNPISHIDVDGMFDWVKQENNKPKWDNDVHNDAQAKAKYGDGATDVGKSATYVATNGLSVNLREGGVWNYDLSNLQAKGTGLDMQGFYSTVSNETPLLNAAVTGIDIGSSFLLPGAEAVSIAGSIADRGVSTIAGETGIAASRALGVAGEEAVGITGPKVAIEVAGRTRVPDRLTRNLLEEVKNVNYQSFTRQLKDFYQYSQENQLQMILHTRTSTTFSKPLNELIQNGSIVRKIIPGL